jgi:hypothetical protein
MPMDDGRNYGSREWNPWNVQSDIAIIHDAMIALSSTNKSDKASEVHLSSGFSHLVVLGEMCAKNDIEIIGAVRGGRFC